MMTKHFLYAAWHQLAYQNQGLLRWLDPLLSPASWLYGRIMLARRQAYRSGIKPSFSVVVPVVSVGNLTVGGVGKTPLVIELAARLKAHGFRPALLYRGYARRSDAIHMLTPSSFDPAQIKAYGDEPAMAHWLTSLPVGIGANRAAVAHELIAQTDCDVILLDDGFQHRKLRRDIDLVVMNGDNPHGNGRCLPGGPLREPASALDEADAIIFRGAKPEGFFHPNLFQGMLEWTGIQPFLDWRDKRHGHSSLESWKSKRVALLSGIGDPARFYAQAEEQGLSIAAHVSRTDHHWFSLQELRQIQNEHPEHPIVMTEKDAIRLLPLSLPADLQKQVHVVEARWRMESGEAFETWLFERLLLKEQAAPVD